VGRNLSLLIAGFLALSLFSLMFSGPSLYVQAQSGTFPGNIFAGTSQAQLHELALKATQENGQTNAVPGFKVDLTNVVSTSANSDLAIFTTDNSLSITEAKVKTSANKYIELVKKSSNSFSLEGLPSRVFTLDVITQKQSEKAAYEGILVVGQATTQQIQNEIVRIETDIDIVFQKPKLVNDPCNYYGRNICNENGECDSERFDCWSDCEDGSSEPTGQCPGDDTPYRNIVEEDEMVKTAMNYLPVKTIIDPVLDHAEMT
jgi:hypothetical protein